MRVIILRGIIIERLLNIICGEWSVEVGNNFFFSMIKVVLNFFLCFDLNSRNLFFVFMIDDFIVEIEKGISFFIFRKKIGVYYIFWLMFEY